MIMSIKISLLIVAALVISSNAVAREDTRPFDGFSRGTCKTSRCFSRHPSGTYVYPHHYGHRQSEQTAPAKAEEEASTLRAPTAKDESEI
jgi:hypothetical protein